MSSFGISRCIRRLEGPRGRFLFLALDHGLPAGPIPGLESPAALMKRLQGAPITGIILTPGIAAGLGPDGFPRILHLSAGTVLGTRPSAKVLGSLPERALALGADAVSVQIHFGDPEEDRMLADAGAAVDASAALGLPVLAMVYPPHRDGSAAGEDLPHAARAAAELGARIVQVPLPPRPEVLQDLVRGCPVPVVLGGGPRSASPEAWLDAIRAGVRAGAAGVSAGRYLFQDPDPDRMARSIGEALFGAPSGA
ncbi:MAG: hypothetical protein A3K68_05350 [Euryarchaeota archaeon RBG_16_68_13]|nr:MAG: hypothetical protein A3K68_05350 [Euryarchaeota archaeon RBG_16_68_13]